MYIFIGPVHFRDVHQAFYALFDFDKCAVVGDIGDLAEQARAFRIAARQIHPRIVAQLFEAEGYAVALAVETQHLGLDFVADLEHFGWMLHALPRQVGDVQQTIDTAQINKRAVIGQVLDHALDDLPLFQIGQQGFALDGHFGLDHGATRYHHVVTLAVELDNLEFQFLTFEVSRIAHWPHIHQRTGQERAYGVDGDGKSALHLVGDDAGDDRLGFMGLLQHVPGLDAAGLLAR